MRHSLQLVCHGIRTAASASAARPSTLAIASAAPRSGLCHYSQISQQRPRASLIVACCQFKLATPGASRSIATVTSHDGVKSTIPSSSKPIDAGRRTTKGEEDRGYLAFTKASLFKLTLPLAPPSPDPKSPASKASSAAARASSSGEPAPKPSSEPWEQRVESGEVVSQVGEGKRAFGSGGEEPTKQKREHKHKAIEDSTMEERGSDRAADEFDADAPAHSVVFLLHSGQPLSYVSSLIRAEGPSGVPAKPRDEMEGLPPDHTLDKTLPTVTFHTRRKDSKRWSPATGLGDFLRDAARLGSFTIKVGEREIIVDVPSFEDRTRFLRARLYAITDEIQRLTHLKKECDKIASVGTKRFAFAGVGILATWWVGVAYCTFATELGWDVMEPATYLVGLGTLMGGYVWFLLHNREVSYRSVLNETTSKRQQTLYVQRGLNLARYEELIDEAKTLRKHIKRVADDYDLEWDQGNTASGEKNKRALDVVRRREAADEKGSPSKPDEEEDEHEDDEDTQEDGDGDGKADGPQRRQARQALKEKTPERKKDD